MKKNSLTLKETFFTAIEEYKKKNFKKAETICYKILSIEPNHFDSILLLATISAMSRDFSNAKELLLKAIELQPKNVSALNNLATSYKELGDIKEAENYYEKVIKIEPENVNANYNLGLISHSQKNSKKAENYFEKTIKIQPNFALAHFTLGNLYAEYKNYNRAEKSYKKAIDIRPNYASAYNNLGLVYRGTGDYQKAIQNYIKTTEINKMHAGAFNNLGRAYTELGEFDKAIESHQKAAKLEPENLYPCYYLTELKKNFLSSQLQKKISKILNKDNPAKGNLIYGNFLLSRYEKNAENYRKEFDHLIQAHQHYFDFKKDKFLLGLKYCFDDVLQISNHAKVDKLNKKIDNKIKPIFIVGVPRCGSTLIEKVIGSGAKNIGMGEETGILENYINQKILDKKSIYLGKSEIIRDELISLYKEKHLINENKNFTFTDKSLNNFFYIQIIKQVFPNAKIINCKRNVLDSIMSIFQNNLTELAWAHNIENIFKYFDIYFQTIEKIKKSNLNLMYEVEYEEFTKNPEVESKKLMKFCELPWDKKCLEFYKRKDIISKTTSYMQIRKSVYKQSKNRYLPYKELLQKYGNKYSWFN